MSPALPPGSCLTTTRPDAQGTRRPDCRSVSSQVGNTPEALHARSCSSPTAFAAVAELRAVAMPPVPPPPAPQSPLTSLLLAGLRHGNSTAGTPECLQASYARGGEPRRPRCQWRLEAGACGAALRRDADRDALTRRQPAAAGVGAGAEKAAVVRKKRTGQSAGEAAWRHGSCCRSRPQRRQ